MSANETLGRIGCDVLVTGLSLSRGQMCIDVLAGTGAILRLHFMAPDLLRSTAAVGFQTGL
jgi:hypothetical protein